ncbi:MAG: multiheme c-type cytochrome [Anaerolineales bacterium]
MKRLSIRHKRKMGIGFAITFAICVAIGGFAGSTQSASASPAPKPSPQEGTYAGPEACANCHNEIHEDWMVTRHAQAFSSPIFQRNWEDVGSKFTCLECHTTGYNEDESTYAFEGVTCESCHGPFQEGHPQESMPVVPNHLLCEKCHETTTDEWFASPHREAGVECQSCHDPHAQAPLAASVTELCGNCHKDTGSSFTHGSHADAGLECSNCHMYTRPRTESPVEGLVPTGHTFTVGSEACIGCHQDTVHTRDVILELTGEVRTLEDLDTDELISRVKTQEEEIEDLKDRTSVRLYTGLAQGAIVGLATGAVVAWVISRKIELVEIKDDEDE